MTNDQIHVTFQCVSLYQISFQSLMWIIIWKQQKMTVWRDIVTKCIYPYWGPAWHWNDRVLLPCDPCNTAVKNSIVGLDSSLQALRFRNSIYVPLDTKVFGESSNELQSRDCLRMTDRFLLFIQDFSGTHVCGLWNVVTVRIIDVCDLRHFLRSQGNYCGLANSHFLS